MRQDALEEATPLVHLERSKAKFEEPGKQHTVEWLRAGGGGRMERDNEPGTDPSGPNKEHLLPCPTHAHNTGCAMRKVSVVGTLCGKMH